VARRLVRERLCARTVTIKVKYADFAICTRQATLPSPVQDTDAIHKAALGLLARIPLDKRRVRLTGVSVGGLVESPEQPMLFPDRHAAKRRTVEEVSVRIAERFGDERAITRATLLEND
jgi:DNA polymerase-4